MPYFGAEENRGLQNQVPPEQMRLVEGGRPLSADYLPSLVNKMAFAIYQVHFRVLSEEIINKIKCSRRVRIIRANRRQDVTGRERKALIACIGLTAVRLGKPSQVSPT